MTKRRIMDVQDGAQIKWQQPLEPAMLTKKGLIVESTVPGLYLRFGREYALSKIKHDFSDSLNLKNKYELMQLVDEVYQIT